VKSAAPPLAAAVLLAAALLLSGCAARFESFAFSLPGGASVPIRESAATVREKEGRLEPADGARATPMYTLRRGLTVAADGSAFALAYASELPDCTLTLYSDGKTVLRSAALPQSGNAAFRFLVPLARGERLRGFRLSSESTAGAFQLRGAGIQPLLHGFSLEGNEVTLDESVAGVSLRPGRLDARISQKMRRSMAGTPWQISLDVAPSAESAAAEAAPNEIVFASPDRAPARFSVDLPAVRAPLAFRPGSVGFVPRDIRATGLAVRRCLITFPSGPGPIPADPGLILAWDRASWRRPDFELFSWASFPHVLILDTSDYRVQDRFFKRLAFFVEKAGFAGSIPAWAALEGRHGYNAHDYRASDLARFFTTARAEGVELLPEEQTLQRILLDEGIIEQKSAGFEAGSGAVLSISRSSSAALRELLITHECFHGVYFSLPSFQTACERAWRTLSEVERRVWREFLAMKEYNTDDPGLVVNEFQSYLFQQPREGVMGFQALTLGRLRVRSSGDAALVARFLAERPDSLLASFDALEADLRAVGGPPGGRAIAVKSSP
jgi:hypothetical protein